MLGMRGASFVQVCSLLATCLIPRPSLAEKPAKEFSVLTTDEAVISATRTAEPIRQSASAITVLDASLQHELRKGLRLILNGENLTDRHYIATQTGPVKTLGSPLLIMDGIRAEY